MSDGELFPPFTRTTVDTRLLETAIATARGLAFRKLTILGYASDGLASPWFCFDVGEHKFAIWTATGLLYSVDEYGAASDDPIPIPG